MRRPLTTKAKAVTREGPPEGSIVMNHDRHRIKPGHSSITAGGHYSGRRRSATDDCGGPVGGGDAKMKLDGMGPIRPPKPLTARQEALEIARR
jgi:hypothetical protein